MASVIFDNFRQEVMNGETDLNTDTFYVMLISSAGVTAGGNNVGTFVSQADFTTYEITGTGYTAAGQAIGSPSVSNDTTNHLAYFDGNDVSWTSATITAYGAVVYVSDGTTATLNQLVCMFDFGGAQTATNGTFTIQWSTAGIVRLS